MKRYTKLFCKKAIYQRMGVTFILDPQNFVDYRLTARFPFEAEQIKYAQKIIQDNNITIFLDIGANIGLYSIILGKLPQIQKTHAFEPVSANYNQLCANIFMNKLDTKIEPHKIALSSRISQENIYIAPQSTGQSRFNPEYSGNPEHFTDKENVKTDRFDNYLPLSGQSIFMKIDVEGHAVDALQGMKEMLSKNSVIIQAELLEFDREEIISCLSSLGYVLFHEIDLDGYFCRA